MVIDSHVHLVDFLQQPVTATALAIALEEADVTHAVVFGLPVKKKWALSEPERPTYYIDDNAPCGGYSLTDALVVSVVQGLPAHLRDRVAPLICGFDPTDRLATDHVELMTERYDGWRGIGEVLLRHDDLTELTYGENARAGHPALDAVLEMCRGRDWPLTFHQDASSAGRSGGREYVGEVDAMLRRHPQVDQVWAHAGASRRVRPDHHAALVRDLLDRHPRLHVDLSWELFDVVVQDGHAHDDWVELLSRRADRFVIGSDTFGSYAHQRSLLARWRTLTDRLSATDSDLVQTGNALRLWWS